LASSGLGKANQALTGHRKLRFQQEIVTFCNTIRTTVFARETIDSRGRHWASLMDVRSGRGGFCSSTRDGVILAPVGFPVPILIARRLIDSHQFETRPFTEDVKIKVPLAAQSRESPIVQRPKPLRIAVGKFDDWRQLQDALRDASNRGFLLDSLNCLALERVFAGKAATALNTKVDGIHPILFPDGSGQIACTEGPLADCLRERLQFGARTLKEALAHWLIPRHAADLEDTVFAGKILLWISLVDAEDERQGTMVLVYSATKGLAAMAMAVAHSRGWLDYRPACVCLLA
jgi:hypothetical protein